MRPNRPAVSSVDSGAGVTAGAALDLVGHGARSAPCSLLRRVCAPFGFHSAQHTETFGVFEGFGGVPVAAAQSLNARTRRDAACDVPAQRAPGYAQILGGGVVRESGAGDEFLEHVRRILDGQSVPCGKNRAVCVWCA